MKRNPLLDTIPGRIIDESAVTIEEIMTDRNISREQASEIRNLNIETGAWEEVRKKWRGKIIRAYRLKKKK